MVSRWPLGQTIYIVIENQNPIHAAKHNNWVFVLLKSVISLKDISNIFSFLIPFAIDVLLRKVSCVILL